MSLRRAERYHAAVRAELDEARAAVLGRVAHKLEQARARCEALAAEIDRAPSADPQVLAEHRSAHADATQLRWILCVQREALGLYDHRWVDIVYPSMHRR